jgi:hypothetical protein
MERPTPVSVACSGKANSAASKAQTSAIRFMTAPGVARRHARFVRQPDCPHGLSLYGSRESDKRKSTYWIYVEIRRTACGPRTKNAAP